MGKTILDLISPLLTSPISNYVAAMKTAEAVFADPRFDISTGLRRRHFLAQVLHETGGLSIATENMNYSAKGLMATWPSRFKTIDDTQAYIHNPKVLANKVYGSRMGNDPAGDDGWNFRGHGMLQITGKESYLAAKKFFAAEAAPPDFVATPDLVNSADWALKVACWEWTEKNCNDPADDDDIETVTRKINGGLIGLSSRQAWYDKLAFIEEI